MIYFDYAATSKKRQYILEEILEDFDSFNGNPDSQHYYGRRARMIMENARESIAKSINAEASQIVFTSGASESNNTVIKAFSDEGHIISSLVEHPSILKALEHVRAEVKLLGVNQEGVIKIQDLEMALREDSSLISLIYVNNETGMINPVEEAGAIAKEKGVWYHLDAVQAYGHIDIDVEELACDSMSLSGHKIGGLNGFGVLYLRDNKLKPMIYGGNQEKFRRAGTSFVVGAYSMARAFQDSKMERKEVLKIKEYFVRRLAEEGVTFAINGSFKGASGHILNIYLPFVKSNFLLTYLDLNGVCASAGSACTAGSLEPSYVVEAIYDKQRAESSVRFSFGFDNEFTDVEKTVSLLKELESRNR